VFYHRRYYALTTQADRTDLERKNKEGIYSSYFLFFLKIKEVFYNTSSFLFKKSILLRIYYRFGNIGSIEPIHLPNNRKKHLS